MQEMAIGKRIRTDSILFFGTKNRHLDQDSNMKVLIFDNLSSCQACIQYFADLLRKNMNNNSLKKNIDLYIVIPTTIVEFGKFYHDEAVKAGSSMLVDKDFKILKKLGIVINNSVVLCLSPQNICLYCFVIVNNNNERLRNQFMLIKNIINSSKIIQKK
jgi:uncharacterized protein YuzB (UPF0349 family)